MIIGVPRERKNGERRVAITPTGAKTLVEAGHDVLIETAAGELSSFDDSEYEAAGAKIANSLEEVWSQANLLVKVKEPAEEEIAYFRPGLAVFCFLHPAAEAKLTKAMVAEGIVGLDYDLLMLEDGRLPILEPMSEIAGKLSIQCGAYALQGNSGGRGLLLGGAIGTPPAKVTVIGAGAAGSNAAKVALGMGAEVSILDINRDKLAPFADGYYRAKTVYSTPPAIARELADSDLVIGSVLVPGALAPKLITRKHLESMRKGSVLVDICIDQGGMAESSKATTLENPTYIDEGVVHYCVPNMPALVPRTSTQALTSVTLKWILAIANTGVKNALLKDEIIRSSLVTYGGRLTNSIVGEALGMKAVSRKDADALISMP